MNSRKLSIALVLFLMLAAVLVGSASACPTTGVNPQSIQCPSLNHCPYPNLPTSPVDIYINSVPAVYPTQTILSGVPKGYDVTNTGYIGWCVDLLTDIQVYTTYSATLSSSLCKSPSYGTSTEWNMVNYILNNVPAGATGQDIQVAIWLAFGFTATQIQTVAGPYGFSVTATAQNMYNAAKAHASCFDACFDKIIAVIVTVPGCQTTMIELKNPCCCNWGCYWDQTGCNWHSYCDQTGCNWGSDRNQGE
jgi:hypothetical protein